MPVKFRLKKYVAGGIYHIYNRGIEGRNIFSNEIDFREFEDQLGKYLGEVKQETGSRFKGERPYRLRHRMAMNMSAEIKLWAYCLMPDHFHLLVKQEQENGITRMMRRVLTNYVMRYNKRHNRWGSLFEGVYKAVEVKNESDVAAVVDMIHKNPVNRKVKRFGPVETVTATAPEEYLYSSLRDYLGEEKRDWVEIKIIDRTMMNREVAPGLMLD